MTIAIFLHIEYSFSIKDYDNKIYFDEELNEMFDEHLNEIDCLLKKST